MRILAALLLLACATVAHAQQQQLYCQNSGASGAIPCNTSGPPAQSGSNDPGWLAYGKINAMMGQLFTSGAAFGLPSFPVLNYGAKCDGVTNDSTAFLGAIAAAVVKGGGKVIVPNRVCVVTQPLVVNSSRVWITSEAFGDGSHDTGSQDNGAVLKWGGGAGATMLQFAPITGASAQALYGDGVQGITFECNSSAAIGLQVLSVKGGVWQGNYGVECTTADFDLGPVGAAGSLGEAADPQGNLFSGIRTRNLNTSGAGWRIRGASGTNASFDTFQALQVVYKNGTGISILFADNLVFQEVQMTRGSGGSGTGVDIAGDANGPANSIFFYDLSPGAGSVLIEGTGTIPTAAKNIQFVGYDLSNGSVLPTLGTGVTGVTIYEENGHLMGSGLVGGGGGTQPQGAVFAGNNADVSTAFGRLPNTTYSQYIYNGSTDGTWYDDGTGKWLIRQDSNHNLQFVRQAGTGSFLFSNGVAIGGNLLCSASTPNVNSGGGTSPVILGTNPCAFKLTEGSGSPTTTLVLNMPTAANGWACQATDQTTPATLGHQTANGTASVTITWGSAPNAADVIIFNCGGF